MWNTLSTVDQTTAELRSEVTHLRDTLGKTPVELETLLADIKEVKLDLERQVRESEENQQGIYSAAQKVDVASSSWLNDLASIKSDLGILKTGLLPPDRTRPSLTIHLPADGDQRIIWISADHPPAGTRSHQPQRAKNGVDDDHQPRPDDDEPQPIPECREAPGRSHGRSGCPSHAPPNARNSNSDNTPI